MRKILFLFFLLLGGCSQSLTGTVLIDSSHHLNPDSEGRSKPLVIGLYQLTKPYPFKEKNYEDLNQHIETSLGETLVDYKTLEIRPHQTLHIKLNFPEDSHYLGITAGFHKLQNNEWKKIMYIPPTRKFIHITIHAESSRIEAHVRENLL